MLMMRCGGFVRRYFIIGLATTVVTCKSSFAFAISPNNNNNNNNNVNNNIINAGTTSAAGHAAATPPWFPPFVGANSNNRLRQRNHPLLLSGKSDKSSAEPEQVASGTVMKKDYRKNASGLFGNIRIPASLFAGAAAASAFALPIVEELDSMSVGIAKRLYYLLMIGALSSQIIAVVVATVTGMELDTGGCDGNRCYESTSINELLYDEKYFKLEWIAVRFHFWSGILLFLAGLGIRSYISIDCYIISRSALGMVASSLLVCFAFFKRSLIRDHQKDAAAVSKDDEKVTRIPIEYIKLLWSTSRTIPIFGVALVLGLITKGYILVKIPHIVVFQSQKLVK